MNSNIDDPDKKTDVGQQNGDQQSHDQNHSPVQGSDDFDKQQDYFYAEQEPEDPEDDFDSHDAGEWEDNSDFGSDFNDENFGDGFGDDVGQPQNSVPVPPKGNFLKQNFHYIAVGIVGLVGVYLVLGTLGGEGDVTTQRTQGLGTEILAQQQAQGRQETSAQDSTDKGLLFGDDLSSVTSADIKTQVFQDSAEVADGGGLLPPPEWEAPPMPSPIANEAHSETISQREVFGVPAIPVSPSAQESAQEIVSDMNPDMSADVVLDTGDDLPETVEAPVPVVRVIERQVPPIVSSPVREIKATGSVLSDDVLFEKTGDMSQGVEVLENLKDISAEATSEPTSATISQDGNKEIEEESGLVQGVDQESQENLEMERLKRTLSNAEKKILTLDRRLSSALSQIETLNKEISSLRTQPPSGSQVAPRTTSSKQEEQPSAPVQKKATTPSTSIVTQKPAVQRQSSVSTQKPVVEIATPKTNWILRAAQPNVAWISQGMKSPIQKIGVGDTVPEIGRVQSIAFENDRWVVRGTESSIVQ